ncbi:MAG: hypothetical protein V4619_15300, partial [Bacteroidota bacterium]
MKKKSILLLAVLVIACTLAKAQAMKPVIIAGRVINLGPKSPQTIKFNFCNPLIDGSITASLDSSGKFNVRQDMLYTQNMTFFYAVSFVNIYVQPGDSIFLTIDAAKLNKPKFGWLNISGSHARVSTQLNLLADTLYRLNSSDINLEQSPTDVLASIKADYTRYMRAADEYNANHKLDPIVIAWAKRDLKFVIANATGRYPDMRGISAAEKLSRLKMYTDPFFDIYNADNFQSMYFCSDLINYGNSLVSTGKSVIELATQNKLSQSLKKAVSHLLKEPPGDARDLLIYHQIKRYARQT